MSLMSTCNRQLRAQQLNRRQQMCCNCCCCWWWWWWWWWWQRTEDCSSDNSATLLSGQWQCWWCWTDNANGETARKREKKRGHRHWRTITGTITAKWSAEWANNGEWNEMSSSSSSGIVHYWPLFPHCGRPVSLLLFNWMTVFCSTAAAHYYTDLIWFDCVCVCVCAAEVIFSCYMNAQWLRQIELSCLF